MGTWIFPINNWIDFSNSILPVLLGLLLYMMICKIRPGKPTAVSAVFGLFFAICMVFGAQLDRYGQVPFTNIKMWLWILLFAFFITIIVSGLWNALDRKAEQNPKTPKEQINGECKYFFWIRTTGVIFLLYLIVFLAVYPGFFVYDAQEEYLEVVTRNFTTHHPLMHVLFMGGTIQLFYKLFGSVNVGIAVYTLLQMTIIAFAFGYFIWKLKQRGLGKTAQWILTLYLGICPPIVMFSLCSAKDGLFSAMLLLQVLLLQDLCKTPEKFLTDKKRWILLGAVTVGMMLFRHNGCYAYIVFLPFLIGFINRKKTITKNQKGLLIKIITLSIAPVIIYFLINRGLAFATNAQGGEHQEILTVPIMQLARTYAYESDSFTTQQKETVFQYLPEEALQRYTPKVSDGVKVSFDNNAYEQNKSNFWKVWLEVGLQHPFSYINAWMMTSYGFWYPDTVIDVYRGNTVFTYTYQDSSYFGYEVEEPGTRESKLPFLNELYRKMSLEIFQQKIPGLAMLFSPGFMFWCVMFGLGFVLNSKKLERKMEIVLPFLLPVLIFMTYLLGPTFLVRYVVFWWTLVPLLAVQIYAILTVDYKGSRNEKSNL